ncbi:ergothioneine biosynthesis protein EgtB [Echinicola marina]|uniref:ergothioneine biosynthesis protein EgtB n=1 Tax=Echinicola marina TaxID=2859768 RepID=UPI001CF6912B|nr:ergothioneine biosynthesis protein EgtB [Echinicola marina]UCS92950.1 ergothioneine biosynthesis protein EgtB [Echinicola marina]
MTYEKYKQVRDWTIDLCSHLETEDFVVQASEHVSPAKWHLAHTTWFFETFVLKKHLDDYKEFHPDFSYFFNSYYNAVGERISRNQRGLMTRPSVEDVFDYRDYIDEQMQLLFAQAINEELRETIVLGLNHEQQHQELLITDLKYNLWLNPMRPAVLNIREYAAQENRGWQKINQGLYSIGFDGEGFCYDNEQGKHQVYLEEFSISTNLVTNGEYLQFVKSGGYQNHEYWLSDAWAWLAENRISLPLYWEEIDGKYRCYTLDGLKELDLSAPVTHVSYYEAAAYVEWAGYRLPTEAEWEIASDKFNWGDRWEWTNSAYLPYPGYKKAAGAIGEYNGKFMINQMVLRGASVATSLGHSRKTYRNFFHPQYRWQFTGIRPCQK